ncbi:MAG: phage terminase large subunit [Clostridia bacterium]|nr:phage terminase large subunit [Clostridia bacterium]
MKLHFPPPFEQQKEFLRARERFVAYGGSRGGGKSFAVRMKACFAALGHAGIRILILRRSYPELYENHIKLLRRQLGGAAEYRDTDKSLTFPNGSLIKFGYCDADSDAERYQGQEYDMIFMDEATHFTAYQFDCLSACLRGTGNYPRRFYLTCNPGGVGHSWVKRLFIDRDYRAGENPADYRFIRSTVYDNRPLLEKDPSYLNRLNALPAEMRRAWLEGDWDLAAGQFFSEFRRDIHVVEPMPLPPHAKIYRAFDYGLDMLACLWFAVDEAGDVLVFRELYEPNLIVSRAAEKIRAASPEAVAATYAPPDLWNRQKDTGRSMWELFEEGGIRLYRADANRAQGWMQVKEYLAPRPRGDGSMRPRLRIFSTCRNLIRCLPALGYDTADPGDCAREPHELTHLPDALRYFLRSRATPARAALQEKEREAAVAAFLARYGDKNRKGRFN